MPLRERERASVRDRDYSDVTFPANSGQTVPRRISAAGNLAKLGNRWKWSAQDARDEERARPEEGVGEARDEERAEAAREREDVRGHEDDEEGGGDDDGGTAAAVREEAARWLEGVWRELGEEEGGNEMVLAETWRDLEGKEGEDGMELATRT